MNIKTTSAILNSLPLLLAVAFSVLVISSNVFASDSSYSTITGQTGKVLTGQVIGGDVLGESCGLYMNMDQLIRQDGANDVEQVKKLQVFLNEWMSAGLPITGFYGPLTTASLNAFQTMYTHEVLTPWNLTAPTSVVYLSTLRWINMLECPDLALPLPVR